MEDLTTDDGEDSAGLCSSSKPRPKGEITTEKDKEGADEMSTANKGPGREDLLDRGRGGHLHVTTWRSI